MKSKKILPRQADSFRKNFKSDPSHVWSKPKSEKYLIEICLVVVDSMVGKENYDIKPWFQS
jgi:hypothetical protein